MGYWDKGTFFLCISCALLLATALQSEVEVVKSPDQNLETEQAGIKAKDHAQGKNQFVIIDGKEYYVGYDVMLTWVEAVRMCASFNMRLISLQTMEKYNTIQNFLNSTDFESTRSCFWTSGIRTEGMNFMWSSLGEEFASNTPWYPGNPALATSTENCVCIWGGVKYDKLHDTPCAGDYKYMCEDPCNNDQCKK